MSRYSRLERPTVEGVFDVPAAVVISEPLSEDEESSDEEYFDASDYFEDCAPDSVRLKGKILEENFSSLQITDEQTQSFSTGKSAKTGKCCGVLDCFSKDVHGSSEDSKVTESSADASCIIKYPVDDEGSFDYVDVDVVDTVEEEDIAKLMKISKGDHYSVSDSKVDFMHAKCRMLFERDYVCEAIDNFEGTLCSRYPVRLIVPVAKKSTVASAERLEAVAFDKALYTRLVMESNSCRLRKRFIAPVLMFNKKFICRAGTITVRKTAVFETASKSPPPAQSQSVNDSPVKRVVRNLTRSLANVSSRSCEAASQLIVRSAIQNLRNIDAQIMRDLNVQYICDLMIEDRKMFNHIRLSSSEKINPTTYCDCNIEQMPYPGCKFFKRYHEAKRIPEGLIFDWNRSDANTEMKFTENPALTFPDINWDDYKKWDVIDLTKNYMKILLSYLAKGTGGLLVHCVSGWDRTPLFISILRVSLWADGIIHESLNYKEMAYLTLAYDWYLFGHNLPKRLKKKQEIMHFCFKFLPYIATDEFSFTRIFHESAPEQREDCSVPDFKPGSRDILNAFSSYALNVYDEFIGTVG